MLPYFQSGRLFFLTLQWPDNLIFLLCLQKNLNHSGEIIKIFVLHFIYLSTNIRDDSIKLH